LGGGQKGVLYRQSAQPLVLFPGVVKRDKSDLKGEGGRKKKLLVNDDGLEDLPGTRWGDSTQGFIKKRKKKKKRNLLTINEVDCTGRLGEVHGRKTQPLGGGGLSREGRISRVHPPQPSPKGRWKVSRF